MKRIVFAIIALCAAAVSLSAQDIITKRDGTTIEAIVMEINDTEVKYKKYTRPEGVTYTLSLSEVDTIAYPNGEKDIFTSGTADVDSDILIYPGMKYKELKKIYNYRDYRKSYSDPHKAGWCTFGSLIIPGLGQACCGEWGRAAIFFGINIASNAISNAAQNQGWDDVNKEWVDSGCASRYAIFSAVSFVNNIWAAVDANHVAKVVNMYYQDLNGISAIYFSVSPDLAMVPAGNSYNVAPGVKFAISF